MKKYNVINVLLRVNQVSYIITWLLFLTIVYGFMAEFFLAILQIVSSLLILFFWKELPKNLKRETFYYWIAVLIYALSFYLIVEFNLLPDSVGLGILGVVFIPMLMGLFLLLHLSSIKKSLYS